MERDDNSPEKSDLKGPKTIALPVKDGRYSTSYFPSGVLLKIKDGFRSFLWSILSVMPIGI